LCISRNKEKQLVSKFGIGTEHLKDNPDSVVIVARAGTILGRMFLPVTVYQASVSSSSSSSGNVRITIAFGLII
jgi:hypothetical protein